jgi:hypothetical protein
MLNGCQRPVKGGAKGPSQCRASSSGIRRRGLTGGQSKRSGGARNGLKTVRKSAGRKGGGFDLGAPTELLLRSGLLRLFGEGLGLRGE